MKFLKSHENNFSTKEISHLEIVYHEPSNEIIVLCFYIANKTSLIYFNDSELLYDCSYEIILDKMSICFFMTCKMKEINNPDVFENYSFILGMKLLKILNKQNSTSQMMLKG